MKVKTTRFGEVEVSKEDIYRFPEGILGVERLNEYALLRLEGEEPLLWLQSTGDAGVAFIICDPVVFKPEYRVSVTREELAAIELENVSEGKVFVILTMSPEASLTTANLQGPLVFNTRQRLAKQVVLTGEEYTTKCRVFAEAAPESQEAERSQQK